MSRDASNRAQQASDRDVALSKQYGGQSDTLQKQLTGIYGGMATNPQGMTPQEKNDATTASMQSTGGSVAGAVGEGNLEAARTGNAGGYQAALADAARKGILQNSKNALAVNNANTALKEGQREQGVAGLQGLQTGDQAASLNAMGQNTGAINAEANASPGWFQNMTGLITAISGAGKSAASLGAHF